MVYADMRHYINFLEEKGLIKRVAKSVDRDWEIAAICRMAFMSWPSESRPALLFENVKGFSISIVAGILGGSKAIYAAALGLDGQSDNMLEAVALKWGRAIKEPISHKIVDNAPCKENVLVGEDVDLNIFPHQMWTVGEDPGYFLTASCVFSKHPDTGVVNIGTYRNQIKTKNKMGVHLGSKSRHLARHLAINEERGAPTPVAIVLGCDPSVGLVSVSSVPYGVDELAVACGLRGEALEVIKCETNDILVPAAAEIVIEGEIPPYYVEHEGPFGEYPGYMGASGNAPTINVKAITYRHNPIYHSFISQMPPSESSLIRGFGREASIFTHLTHTMGYPVSDVRLKESGGSAAYLAISMKKQFPGQVLQVVWGAWSLEPTLGKITVVVDDDIDIRDDFALDWAISFRTRPAEDYYTISNSPAVANDPSCAPKNVPKGDIKRQLASKLIIDATKKHEFPAMAIPPQQHLERVKANWEEYFK